MYIYIYVCLSVYKIPYLSIYKIPGEGNGNPLQYSCLKNPMDRGAWSGRLQSTGLQSVGHECLHN